MAVAPPPLVQLKAFRMGIQLDREQFDFFSLFPCALPDLRDFPRVTPDLVPLSVRSLDVCWALRSTRAAENS